MIPVDGGEASKLTDHKSNIRAFEWTKDSASIVFLAERIKTDAQKAAEKAGDDAIFVDEGANGQDRAEFSELWRVTIADKSEQAITRDDKLLIESFRVAPDGKRIAVIYRRDSTRNGQNRAEIAVADVATGALTTVTRNEAPEQNVQWSPEGKALAYLAPSNTSWDLAEDKLWVVPAEGGEPRKLTASFNGAIGQYSWSADGQSIVFGAHDARARRRLQGLGRHGGRRSCRGRQLVGPDGIGLRRRQTRRRRDQHAGRARRSSRDRSHDRQDDADHARQPEGGGVLARAVQGDDLEEQGRPRGRRHALAAERLHSRARSCRCCCRYTAGPPASGTSRSAASTTCTPSLGWAVLEPNVRGSSSYGDALLRGNMKDIGGGDYQDLMTGVDKLIADGIADPDRLAIRGWSYGGILGGWTLTQTSRFKAASLGSHGGGLGV